MRICGRRGSFQARPHRYAVCTVPGFTFSGSLFPYLPLHMHLVLLQPLYRARESRKFALISIDGPIRFLHRLKVYIFGLSYLPFHLLLALVQPLYRASGSHRFAQISYDGSKRRGRIRINLQDRPGRCAFCTDSRFTFLGSPSP